MTEGPRLVPCAHAHVLSVSTRHGRPKKPSPSWDRSAITNSASASWFLDGRPVHTSAFNLERMYRVHPFRARARMLTERRYLVRVVRDICAGAGAAPTDRGSCVQARDYSDDSDRSRIVADVEDGCVETAEEFRSI